MDALIEAIKVLIVYGTSYFAGGMIVSFVMVAWGAYRKWRVFRLAFLIAAIFILWGAVFLGIDSGYRKWQSLPQPPEEAFSDTGGPFFALFLGWLPSAIVLGPAFMLFRAHAEKKDEQGLSN